LGDDRVDHDVFLRGLGKEIGENGVEIARARELQQDVPWGRLREWIAYVKVLDGEAEADPRNNSIAVAAAGLASDRRSGPLGKEPRR
jgi:hypothetical protein